VKGFRKKRGGKVNMNGVKVYIEKGSRLGQVPGGGESVTFEKGKAKKHAFLVLLKNKKSKMDRGRVQQP